MQVSFFNPEWTALFGWVPNCPVHIGTKFKKIRMYSQTPLHKSQTYEIIQ